MRNLNYPLDFTFKITTLANDFRITDAKGNNQAYVRSKIFKLKDEVIVYSDESKKSELVKIKANQWIDFHASYEMNDLIEGRKIGRIQQDGFRSIWRSHYQVFDSQNQLKYKITERNPWVKVADSAVGEIPILGFFSGYFLNPSYLCKDQNGKLCFELVKEPSFFGRRFKLHKLSDVSESDEELVLYSFLMMVLLSRSRG